MADQADIDALTTEAKDVLDYRPNLSIQRPRAIPGTDDVQQTIQQAPNHIVQDYILELLATQNDLLSLQSWMNEVLPLYGRSLVNIQIPIAGDTLGSDVQQAVRSILNRDYINFADALDSYEHPENPASSAIKKLWSRSQYGIDGSIAGSLYFNLWRINKYYLPAIQNNLTGLMALSAYGILNSEDASPGTLVAGASQENYDIPLEQIVGYMKVGSTLSSQVSDLFSVTNNIQSAVNSQALAAPMAGELISQLSGVVATAPGSSNKVDLAEIITVLRTLKTLFIVQNDITYISLAGIEQRLDQLIENLLLEVLGEAANIYAHLESMLMAPIVGLIRKLDQAFGGAGAKVMDDFADKLTILLNGVVGKFESHMLDMYRHTALHNNLTNVSIDKNAQNNNLRNLVKTVDLLIEALELLNGNQINWESIAVGIADQVVSRSLLQILPKLPSQAKSSAPPGTNLSTLTTNTWGLNLTGTPGQVASSLATNILALTGSDGGVS
jgi:hypothetical protein